MRVLVSGQAMIVAGALATSTAADSTLSLSSGHGAEPIGAGDRVAVTLAMSDLGANEVAGFQAFLQFDSLEVTFVAGEYASGPFGLRIIEPIEESDGTIALAAGIDREAGQEPTSEDADLAVLVFESIDGGCIESIGFAEHQPPSRLTTDQGESVTPLTLLDLSTLPTAGLFLAVDYGTPPIEPGDFIEVTLSMNQLCAEPAVGFQAFLRFDPSAFAFVRGVYMLDPFGVHILDPIMSDGDLIALAAGIDVERGQPPARGPADLAVLTFRSVGGGCADFVGFAAHDPPSRLSDATGEPISPIDLVDPAPVGCRSDVVPDCVVDFDDLLAVLSAWGPCEDEEACPEDIDGDGEVRFEDLLFVLSDWGPCL